MDVYNIFLHFSLFFLLNRHDRIRCISQIGKVRSNVTVSKLDLSCLNCTGSIAHELGHVIGLRHEHNRKNRNDYIRINFDNILYHGDYKIKTDRMYYHSTYDFGSIMHYPPISKHIDVINMSLPIFELLENVTYKGEIGQRKCLSKNDVAAVKALFGCENNSGECCQKLSNMSYKYSANV